MFKLLFFFRYITIFRTNTFRDYIVDPGDWKGGLEHQDDVLACSFLPSHTLATGSYDGEIIIWNINSEMASRRMNQRSRAKHRRAVKKDFVRITKRNETLVELETNGLCTFLTFEG